MATKLTVKEVGLPSFVRKKHDLDKLSKKLAKEVEAAVDALINILETTKDEKVRLAAAKSLIEYNIDVSDKINKDEMQRLIAEVRLNPTGAAGRLEADSSGISRAVINFNEIQDV